MKNATYVDQCDTIRTLTEEEMAVVSGGNWITDYNALQAKANAFHNASPSVFLPSPNMNYGSSGFYNAWWAILHSI